MGGILGLLIGLMIAIVSNFSLWFYSDKIAISVYRGRMPNPKEKKVLEPMVKYLCYRADLPVPKLYIIPSSALNAFATGRSPKQGVIAVTEGLLRMLPEDELEGVVAHELSHIKHRDTLTATIAASIAGSISMLTQLSFHLLSSRLLGTRNSSPIHLVALIPTLILAPITASIIQFAISRTREYEADAGASKLTGNPQALANALRRIENHSKQVNLNDPSYAALLIINPLKGKRVHRLFSTHPPTSDRIQKLTDFATRGDSTMNIKTKKSQRHQKVVLSTVIALTAFGLAYAPIPGLEKTVVVVSGTELAEPLKQLETQFEQQYPNINLELKFQGSQDIVNNYIDDKNYFKPTVIIPASTEFLDELSQRWQTQHDSEPFYQSPRAIAKTFLVGIAWPERGNILFPNGRFSWNKIEQAMQANNWGEIGGQTDWGSFDFIMTDPTRSNSGQLTLDLWAKSKIGNNHLNHPSVESLFKTVKKSVYLPPRSTDILLQEFITRGPNDADVATVYESIALERWQQSHINQSEPYQIYYLDPTIETVATAAIVRRNVNTSTAKAARQFIDFLTQPQQQKVLVQFGFRPVQTDLDLATIPGSPWSQNIPGVEVNPAVTVQPVPASGEIREIQRLWQRVTP